MLGRRVRDLHDPLACVGCMHSWYRPSCFMLARLWRGSTFSILANPDGLSLWQNLTGSSDLRVRSCGSQCAAAAPPVWETRLPVLYETMPRTALCVQISQAIATVGGELATGAWFCLNGVANVLLPLRPLCLPLSPTHTYAVHTLL